MPKKSNTAGRKRSPTLDAQSVVPKRFKRVQLSDALASAKVTGGMVRRGTIQEKMKAFYALHALPIMFNAAMKNASQGDPKAIQQLGEIYGMLGGQKGVNIKVEQNNANSASAASAARLRGDASNVDEMFRQLAEEREQRRALGTRSMPMELEATPVDEGDAYADEEKEA